MKLFPGVRAKMGRWTYYLVKMTMRDLQMVKFAEDFGPPSALGETLQRTLNQSRSKREIVSYLTGQQDRFFNSIVIAGIGGSPKWFPVDMQSDPTLALLEGDPLLTNSFGVLRFSGNEDYYALDGQHRLLAIKDMTNPASDASREAPKGFDQEEMSVVLVVPGEAEDLGAFRTRFRRLFGNLNRYSKPTSKADNIIMDEDDVFAICTRRLFVEHRFFKVIGNHQDSLVVDTHKGANMTRRDPHFTKLEVLYDMNISLLSSRQRKNAGWNPEGETIEDFKRFRPLEPMIDDLFTELANIWTALLEAVPTLTSEPIKMRNHSVIDSSDTGDEQDHLLFWPVGQLVLARVTRTLIDEAPLANTSHIPSLVEALAPFASVPWSLASAPWRHLFVVPSAVRAEGWTMRNEKRKEAMAVGENLLVSLLSVEPLESESLEAIKQKWYKTLINPTNNINAMWQETLVNFDRD